jgi:hypothetical protein
MMPVNSGKLSEHQHANRVDTGIVHGAILPPYIP